MHVGNAVRFPCKNSALFGLHWFASDPCIKSSFLRREILGSSEHDPPKIPGWWNILFHPYEMLWYQSAKMHMIISLGGGIKYVFKCSSLFGEEISILAFIFFRGVESWFNHQAVTLVNLYILSIQTFRCSPLNTSHFTFQVDKSSGCLVTPQETEKMTTWGGWIFFFKCWNLGGGNSSIFHFHPEN